jgi:DNA primase
LERIVSHKLQELLSRLDGVRRTGEDSYVAKCSAHADRSPSLAIKLGRDGRTLIHCFAGCEPLDILDSIGLTLNDLFAEPLIHNKPLTSEQEQRRAKQEAHKIWKASTYLEIVTNALKKGEALTDQEIAKARKAKSYLQSRGILSCQ